MHAYLGLDSRELKREQRIVTDFEELNVLWKKHIWKCICIKMILAPYVVMKTLFRVGGWGKQQSLCKLGTASEWWHFTGPSGLVGGHGMGWGGREGIRDGAFKIDSSAYVKGKRSEDSPMLRSVRGLVGLGCGAWWDGMGRRYMWSVQHWPDCVELCVPN